MSPASQGTLEVDRYIGSCLISSSARGNAAACSTTSHGTFNHKSKKVANNGGSKTSAHLSHRKGSDVAANSIVVAACQDHHFNISAGIYQPSNNIVKLCECGNLNFGAARYGSSGRNARVGGNWTGLPLISMAPPNSRRNKKGTFANIGVGNSNGNPKTIYSNQQVIASRLKSTGFGRVEHDAQQTRNPLSRLAIHTQGAPLILSGRYSGNSFNHYNNVRKTSTSFINKETRARQSKDDPAARRGNGVRESGVGEGGGCSNKGTNSNNSTPSSDCLSVASDESSGHSENSLPRIIKPRKRRKKDRKAPPSTDAFPEIKIKEVENSVIQSPSIVTLRPYVPLCYDVYDGRLNENTWSFTKEDGERKVKVWEIENKLSYRLPYVIEVQADDEKVSHTSDDDSLEPTLHHNFDEVEENEEGLLLETSASIPYHFPTTLCHCRYCDPSGLIWDVEQHYYSPLLTPPSLTSASSNKLPFANVPLYFSPPAAAVLSFDFLNEDLKYSSSHTLFKESTLHSGLLRRSWSEPLYSELSSKANSNDGSECDCGGVGSSVISDGKYAFNKYKGGCTDIGNKKGTTISTGINVFPSQSLEVSTEIVTSPNGHRDIEIKFYSCSPPAEAAMLNPYSHNLFGEVDNNSAKSMSDVSETSPNLKPKELHGRNSSVESVQCHSKSSNQHKKGSKLCKMGKVLGQCSTGGDNGFSVSDKCGSDFTEEEQNAKKLGERVGELHLYAEQQMTSIESAKQ